MRFIQPLWMHDPKKLKASNTSKSEKAKYPTVSLIISNFNGKGLLRNCLRSLFDQDYAGKYEVIVVDAGSIDGTSEMIAQEFPQTVIVRENRIGIGEAINLGVRKAQGEVLAIDINNDEVFQKDWLSILINALQNNPNVGIVGGMRVLYGTKNTVDEAGIVLDYLGIPSSHIRDRLSDISLNPVKVDYTGILLFRRDLINVIGEIDEHYVLYSEDADYCARARAAGYATLLVPEAISYHKRSVTIGKASSFSVYYERRNHIRFILVNFPVPRVILAAFWHIILLTGIDALASMPVPKPLLDSETTRLHFLFQRGTRQNFRAIIEAVLWNVRNFRMTESARSQRIFRSRRAARRSFPTD